MVGIGYDSHRFAEGRKLILGGVEIDHPLGLEGHSDADVLTHAVIDAILGAVGRRRHRRALPARRGALAGRRLDRPAADRDRTIAGRVINVDATLICEEPKLGPYKPQMEQILGEATSGRITVKATTNEGMGWIGRGEGIACIAVAEVEDD